MGRCVHIARMENVCTFIFQLSGLETFARSYLQETLKLEEELTCQMSDTALLDILGGASSLAAEDFTQLNNELNHDDDDDDDEELDDVGLLECDMDVREPPNLYFLPQRSRDAPSAIGEYCRFCKITQRLIRFIFNR